MTHISIEGMDGVGKSTVCKILAEKLGCRFVEKPLHYLFDEDGTLKNYMRISSEMNDGTNRFLSAWFYGLGSVYMYEKFKDETIVTDRHLLSNYAWNGNSEAMDMYKLLLKNIGVPKITVILYCPEEEIAKRIINRGESDSDVETDLAKAKKTEEIYSRMIDFCLENDIPYCRIDTSLQTPNETVEEIIGKI